MEPYTRSRSSHGKIARVNYDDIAMVGRDRLARRERRYGATVYRIHLTALKGRPFSDALARKAETPVNVTVNFSPDTTLHRTRCRPRRF